MIALQTIRLGGVLGKRFGRVHKLAVSSAAEASHALCQMIPGFERFLWESKDAGLTFAVYVDGKNVGKDQLGHPAGGEIEFVPVVQGSKNSGALMTVLGAVLVVVGIFLIATPFGAPLIGAGVSLMVGGLVMMLAPQPKDQAAEDDADKRASYAFNGPVNTQAQGNPVPLLYGGPLTIGSAVASASIDVEEQAYVPTHPSTNPGGGGSWLSHFIATNQQQ